ncbi:hypothetical protein HA402_011824 [Bradysia odoriphaga]|nr:hypothetical protein HA402_011824 [Bradysia odoriphaga]
MKRVLSSCIECTEYQKICPLEALPFNLDGEVAVAKEFPHMAGRSATNDIALLKIDRTVDFSQYIQPACLPHTRPSSLQKVPLNLVPFDVCKESYPPSLTFREGLVNQTQLCAGSNRGERDTCAVIFSFRY